MGQVELDSLPRSDGNSVSARNSSGNLTGNSLGSIRQPDLHSSHRLVLVHLKGRLNISCTRTASSRSETTGQVAYSGHRGSLYDLRSGCAEPVARPFERLLWSRRLFLIVLGHALGDSELDLLTMLDVEQR